jgi:hypothetical protein
MTQSLYAHMNKRKNKFKKKLMVFTYQFYYTSSLEGAHVSSVLIFPSMKSKAVMCSRTTVFSLAAWHEIKLNRILQ